MNVVDWGLIDFQEAWRRQREVADAILHHDAPDTLVLCEHPPVITLGRVTKQGSVITPADLLRHRGIDVVEINRGGEATVHNPGQLVGYPIFNLQRSTPDLHWFLRSIEGAVIDTLATYGIVADRVDGLTGVWVEQRRKICAIGIHCSRWITTHGFALNVANNLDLFQEIIPCGITDRGVTSMAQEVPAHVTATVDIHHVKASIAESFRTRFP
jgi:lipoyl(octanoyl) transferase